MLPAIAFLRHQLRDSIGCQCRQGYDTARLEEELNEVPDSYDALAAFAERLARLPLRANWPYVEPDDLEGIRAESHPDRPIGQIKQIALEEASARAEAAFLGSVCGCILGKPLECSPTLDEIRTAGERIGEWPLNDYVTESMLKALGKDHSSWVETVRERIHYVAADDDINYTIIGMLVLEEYGINFTKQDLVRVWLHNLPPMWTWGPERLALIKAAISSVTHRDEFPLDEWVTTWQPGTDACGALIRADAYGYACLGQPELASELAWRDASWTHRRTGIYGAMFIAAAIACAVVMPDPLAICETALQFVPQRSQFHEIALDCFRMVCQAVDWLDGYTRINTKYGKYGHCDVYQEIGTLINTLRFAESVGDGICKQVAQGNDTDSFGATAGSILGAFFGPGSLEDRWLTPFRDRIHPAVAGLHETSLSAVAKRMGQLPALGCGG